MPDIFFDDFAFVALIVLSMFELMTIAVCIAVFKSDSSHNDFFFSAYGFVFCCVAHFWFQLFLPAFRFHFVILFLPFL